ncbi:MAG: hypothetical protein PWP23_2647 [Candidatus Sumerlaeota bacterium]|nr:hypothetical protein [Candidatus Sumerlaeota bacterium]
MTAEQDVAIQQFMENLEVMERNLQALLATSRSWSSQAGGQQALRLVMRDFHQLQARSLDLMREIGHMDAQPQHLAADTPHPPVSLSFGADDDLLADDPVSPDPPTPAPRHERTSSLNRLMSSMPEEVRKRLEKHGIE